MSLVFKIQFPKISRFVQLLPTAAFSSLASSYIVRRPLEVFSFSILQKRMHPSFFPVVDVTPPIILIRVCHTNQSLFHGKPLDP